MKTCSQFEEYMYLDVLGEIPPEEKDRWDAHISQCAHCRKEKKKLEILLTQASKELGQVSLSPFEATMLREKISSAIQRHKKSSALGSFFAGRMKFLLPVAAAACLFLVSFLGFRQWWNGNSPYPVIKSTPKVEQQAIVEEKEIIENLDLLEQMDTLRALVKVVDNKDII